MPTLNINGQKVKVGDEFLRLSPEQQEQTVEEIAQSLVGNGNGQVQRPMAVGANAPDQGQGFASRLSNAVLPTAGAAIDGIAQGLTFGFSDEIAAGLQTGFGLAGDYGQALEAERARMRANREAAPGTALAGELVGGIATGAGLAKSGVTLAGRATGAGLGKRAGLMAGEGAAYGAAYGAGTAEGGAADRLAGGATGASLGATIGGAIPVVGAGIRGGVEAIGDQVMPTIRAVSNPAREAARRVGVALERDATMGQRPLSMADESAAVLNNQPIMNFDRGGETVRALTRSVANQSPESRGVVERVVSDRFEGQAARAKDVIARVAGGQVDDLAFQDSLRSAARKANSGAYRRAYGSPAAQSMWNEGFEQLMQAPAIQRAARQATTRSANRAAAEGATPVRNPFLFGQDGRFTLATRPDGSQATPSLAFWDTVKINLDDQIGRAKRSGSNQTASDLMALKSQLVGLLDDAVPEYKAARQGAAAFFGADDAVEAGRKFVTQNRDFRQSVAAIKKMTPAEREAFKTGFAAELSETLGKVSDRRNVISQIFGSPQARQKIDLALGRDASRELEQFVKLEYAMDMMRGALGNSKTARQFVELGLGAGGGVYLSGDWTGALAGAAAARGGRMIASRGQEETMRRIADILLSGDRTKLAEAAKLAIKSRQQRQAIDAVLRQLEGIAAVPAIQQAASN